MSWSEWVNFVPPEDATEAFKDGMDLRRKLTTKSIEEQCKLFNIDPNKYTKNSRPYKPGSGR